MTDLKIRLALIVWTCYLTLRVVLRQMLDTMRGLNHSNGSRVVGSTLTHAAALFLLRLGVSNLGR